MSSVPRRCSLRPDQARKPVFFQIELKKNQAEKKRKKHPAKHI